MVGETAYSRTALLETLYYMVVNTLEQKGIREYQHNNDCVTMANL